MLRQPLIFFVRLLHWDIVELSILDRLLWFASGAAPMLVLICLIRRRLLAPPFRGFAVMLLFGVLRELIMLVPPYGTHAYTVVWECSLVPVLAAQVWTANSALSSIALLYPRLGRFAVQLFSLCLAATACLSFLGLPFEVHRVAGSEAVLRLVFLVYRWVDTLIAGTLILTSAFFLRFPAPLKKPPRNVVAHIFLLGVYFASYATLFLVENFVRLGALVSLERVQSALVLLLYAVWTIVLTADGCTGEEWPRVSSSFIELVGRRNRTALALLRYAVGK